MTTKFLNGPEIMVELDASQVYPNDPGAGTPAIVLSHFGYSATYHCALDNGELENSRGQFKKLTKRQIEWLEKIQDEVDEFLNIHSV